MSDSQNKKRTYLIIMTSVYESVVGILAGLEHHSGQVFELVFCVCRFEFGIHLMVPVPDPLTVFKLTERIGKAIPAALKCFTGRCVRC